LQMGTGYTLLLRCPKGAVLAIARRLSTAAPNPARCIRPRRRSQALLIPNTAEGWQEPAELAVKRCISALFGLLVFAIWCFFLRKRSPYHHIRQNVDSQCMYIFSPVYIG